MVTQAAECLSRSLGPTNVRTIAAYQVMGNLQFQSELYADAATTYGKVADLFARVVGPHALKTISARENAGVAREYAGQFAKAESSLARTLSLARAALGWTHPTTEDLRYHLADFRLDRRNTAGVDRLLSGLSARVLNEGEIESDWAGRLMYERGRLALYTGDAKRATAMLEIAAREIAAKDPKGPISMAEIGKLIRAARAIETGGRTTRD